MHFMVYLKVTSEYACADHCLKIKYTVRGKRKSNLNGTLSIYPFCAGTLQGNVVWSKLLVERGELCCSCAAHI